MKAMQTLKELGNAQLETKLAELRKEQFALRAKKSTGSLEKPASLKLLRKQIARVLTLINSKTPKTKKGLKRDLKKGDVVAGENKHG